MNLVANYMKNIGKSVAYATIANVKEKAPAMSSFTESNQDLYMSAYHSIRDYKTTIQKTKNIIQESPVYKAGDSWFSNAMEDIKSGNLYNQAREEDAEFGDEFGDMGDFGESSSSTGSETPQVPIGDQMVVKSINDSSRKNAYAVTNSVATSAKYIADTSKSIANMAYVQNTRMMGVMQSGFGGLSNGIDALHNFNVTVMGAHAENAQKFFTTITQLDQERNALLKEMRDMMFEQHKAKVEKEKEKKYNRFEDIVNVNGTPDLKAYTKAIGGNLKNTLNEQSGGMMGFLTEDNLKALTTNPLGFIPQLVISTMMGPGLNTAIQKFDKTISGAFGTAIAKLNSNAENDEKSPLSQFFGKVFGLKSSIKSSIDTSKFERGAISFDGETKKSIVEIIPGHLRKIEAALTGMPERIYDLKSGRWTDAHALKKSFSNIKEGSVKSSMGDISEEMGQMLKTMYFENRKDKEDFIKGMQSAFTKIYDNFGAYNPNDKDSFKHTKYGFKNRADQKLFDQMFKNLRHGTSMNMANEVMNARGMQNNYMEGMEKSGSSSYNNLFNNSNLNDVVKVDEKTGKIKAKLGNIGDSINPLKVEDKFKKNIFDYLRGMENYLFDIRKINANATASNLRGSGGNYGIPLTGGVTNYAHFTDTDWAKHDAGRMGTPTKSQKDIDKDRENNANASYHARAKTEHERRLKDSQVSVKYDPYADNQDSQENAILQSRVIRDVRDQSSAMRDNSTWLNDMFKDSAKNAKNTLADKEYMKEKPNGKKESIFKRLMHAESLSEKYAVIRDSLGELASKPATILTSVLGKADEQIYDFFYGKETGEKDSHGNPIRGFFNKMSNDMSKTFSRLNGWIDDKILDPINKRFGGKSLWDSGKKALKNTTGVDVDEIYQKGKDFFVGSNGILRPTIDSVKDAYKQAYEEMKRDMKKSYKDAKEFVVNDIMNEETDEQKSSRVRGITGINNISEATAFRHAIAGSASTKQAIARKQQYIAEKNSIMEKLKTEKDPKKIKLLQAKLNKANANISSIIDSKVDAFSNRNNKISALNNNISSYGNDDSSIINARENKTKSLSKLKGILELDDKESISNIDVNDPKYAYLRDSGVAKSFKQAKSLEAEIAGMKTDLEKLKEERDKLSAEQKKAWELTGTSKEGVLSSNKFLMEQASKNKSSFDGDPKAYDAALRDLSNILGISDDSKSKLSDGYTKTGDLERQYFKAIKGLTKVSDPEKVLRVKINKVEADGGKPSKLISQLNKIIASKGAMFGRYRSTFSEALGNLGLSEEQIETTVNNLLEQNTPEELKRISESSKSFIGAARKANPYIGKLISDYTGPDTNVGNLVSPNKVDTFYNRNNSDYDQTNSPFWKENTSPDGQGGWKAINPISRIEAAQSGSIPFMSHSEKINSDKEYRRQTGLFADGTRMITKAGLAVLSPGEAVIPADENPDNPDMNIADRSAQSKNEKRIKKGFLSSIKNKIGSNDIGEYANGTSSYGSNEKPGVFAQGFSNAKNAAGDFIGQIFGGSDVKNKLDKANETVRKHIPNGIAGGMVGGTAGLLLGGPLLGAIIGSATSIAANSETLQESLFGKKIVDGEGKQGRDDSGFITGQMQKSVSKYLPDLRSYGVAGGLLGLVTPFGPLGGIMLGSGIAFAKNNDSVKKALFGKKDGLVNGDTQKLIKKAFPNVAAATVGLMALGPFGILGNSLIGAGIGMVSSTDEFKDFMLGKADKDGKRAGGLAGELRSKVVGPLADMASGIQKQFTNFVKKDMLDPVTRSIAPIGKQISLALKDTFKGVGSIVGKALKSTLGVPLIKRIGETLGNMMDPYGLNKKILKYGTKMAKGALSAPSKAIGWLGDKARAHQIRKSNADYMTADERLEFMDKRGNYKMQDYDTMLSNSDKGDLEKVRDLMGTIKEGRGFLDDKHEEYVKDLGKTVSDKFEGGVRNKILKAAHAGHMDEVHRLIQESGLGTAEKDELFKKVNTQSEKVREIKYRKENYSGNESEMFKELQEKYGVKGINKDNIDKYKSVLNTEIQSRSGGEAKKVSAEPTQANNITSSLDANTNRLADFLKIQTDILAEIRDNALGVNADQHTALNATKELGTDTANMYSAENHKNARIKNKVIEKMYGKDFKIADEHENTFQDNPEKYKKINDLGKAGYLFNDLNQVLKYDGIALDRFIKLAQTGYTIKDYKKIAEMSDAGFENVFKFTNAGMPITNMDDIINADSKTIDGMVELYEGGYDNVGQTDLKTLTKKKSQLLRGKDSATATFVANMSTNADKDKKPDIVEKTNKNIYQAKQGRFSKGLHSAKGFLGSLANGVANEYGEPSVLSKGELVVEAKKNPVLSAIAEHASGTIAAGMDKFMSKSAEAASIPKSKETVVNTDYGPAIYKKSTDGELQLAKTKENVDIADKIKDRDQTQKGILENLKIMAGNTKNGVKGLAGKAKEGSGGLLGLLAGLGGLLKLPMKMLSELGGIINLPMKLLGLGGVLPKLGGAALSMGGKALGWAGGKIGGLASKGLGMLAGTTLGKKAGGLINKLSNSKVGRLFGKAKSALGFGDSGGAGMDADGNTVDNPTDPASAVNTSRDAITSYLSKIVDLLGGGSGVGGSKSSIADAIGGNNGTATKGKGVIGKVGSFLGKHAGKIALAGLAYKGYSALSGSGDTVGDTGSSMLDYASDAAMLVGVPKLIPGLGEFASGILAKTKDALQVIGSKIGKWIPKGAGEAVQKFFGAVFDRVKDPKNIEKIAKRAGIKAGFDAAEASAGIGTLGLGALAIGAGEVTMWFMKGWNSAADSFDLQQGATPTMSMKIISGLAETVVGMTPIGYAIDTKDVVDLATEYVGPALGFSKADVNKVNSDATAPSDDSDNSQDKGFFENAWDKTKDLASGAWNTVKTTAGNAWDSAKSMYSSAKSSISNWYNSKFGDSSGSGKYGRGKYGQGPGDIGSAFQSQLDPNNAMQFNAPGDTETQTMEDSGCGPVSAANLAAAMGVDVNAKQAASYALGKGYKEKDGGTKPGFFSDYLGKYGIGTEQIGTGSVTDNLKSGNPVVLMGKDNAGTSDKTPYGQYNHYVTATGMDGKGNITVQDPESNTPDQTYKASDVINKSSIAIAGKGKAGKGKYGRGNINLSSKAKSTSSSKFGRGRYGRGADDGGDDVPSKVWQFLASKGLGSTTIAAIMGNIAIESGGFNLDALSNDGASSYGLCQWTASRKDNLFALASQMGQDPSSLDVQLAFLWQELTGPSYSKALADTIACGDDIDKATETFCNEFEGPSIPHLDRRQTEAARAFQTQGKGMATQGTYTPGNSGSKSSGKDYSGLFGKLAQLTDTLSGAFDLGSSPASVVTSVPKSTVQTAATQQDASLADLTTQLKANKIGVDDFIQKADDNPDINRDQIWQALVDAGMGDDNTRQWYDNYYASMDSASKDDNYLKLVDDMQNQVISIPDFIAKADAMPNVPRNSIKHVFMQNGMWDNDTKAAYDEYYDAKDKKSTKPSNDNKKDDTSTDAKGKYGRGKALSAMKPRYGRNRLAKAFGRGTDDAPAAPDSPAPATAASSDGIFGTALSAASSMASKVKSSLGPLASNIGSVASKMFGGNIAKVFGNSNPFTSIFSSSKSKAKSSNGNSTGGKFTSTATNEGVKTASNWAESKVDTEGYGNNGCTAFTQAYLKAEGNPFADQMSLNCTSLEDQAQSSNMWKDPNQGGSEGDMALLETNSDWNDGPDHAVIYDGQGGCWGNSSSQNLIKHYPNMLSAFPEGIHGYVSTGSGDSSVASQDGTARSEADAKGDAGSSSGGGKYGRGKFGRGLAALRSSLNAKGKFGKGTIDDIKTSINGIPMNNIPSYDVINDDDSISVAQAKADKIKQLNDNIDSRIIDPNATTDSDTGIVQTDRSLTKQINSAPSQQQVMQASAAPIDNSDKFDTMIQLMTSMNGALAVIANALTSDSSSGTKPTSDTKLALKSMIAKLNSNGGGLSDTLAGNSSQSIINAMSSIASM